MRANRNAFAIPLLLLVTAALALPLGARAKKPKGVGIQAKRLYEAKRYEEACPLFEKLATEAKSDGARWADLGLCEFRRGRVDAGVRASLLAVRYGDAATRKNAYFHLDRAGVRAQLPMDTPGDEIVCRAIPAAPPFECEAELQACLVPWQNYGSGGGTTGTSLVFATDAESLAYWKTLPSWERDRAAGADNAVQLRREEEKLCGWCYDHAWSCDSSRVVLPKADACFRKATARKGKPSPDMCYRRTPSDAKLCDEYMKCFDALCAKAQAAYETDRSLWPAAADEITRARAQCDDCGVQEATTCEVIAIDPCARRVGYACSEERLGKAGKRTIVERTLTTEEAVP